MASDRKRKPIDLAKRNWTARDFGIPTNTETKDNVASVQTGPGVVGTPPPGTQYLPVGTPPQPNLATTGETPQTSFSQAGEMAAYFLDPLGFVSQQQKETPGFMQDIQKQYGPVGNIATAYVAGRTTTTTFLQNLFNVDDEKETGIETAWDGFLKGFSIPYQALNQLTVAGLSALPGGSRTLTWDESGNATVGQMLVANPGISVGKFRRGEASLGDFAEAFSPFGLIGQLAGSIDPNTKVQQAGFDISTPEGQAAMASGWEKFFSGVGDVGFMFADPLIAVGAAGKVARIRWVDKPIVSDVQRAALKNDLAKDQVFITNGTPNNASPVGQFVHWATETDASGKKLRSLGEIYNHPVIKDAADRDGLTAAINMADNFEDGSLIMRSAYGDVEARKALFAKRADIAAEIGQANRQLLQDKIRFNPSVKKATVDTLKGVVQDRYRIVREYESAFKKANLPGNIEPPALTRARADLLKAQDDLAAARSVTLQSAITHPLSQADLTMSKKVLDDLVARDRALQAALNNSIVDSFVQSNRKFSANNAFGRMVERSRQRRATARYESQATQGLGWKQDEFFQRGRFIRAVRLWQWMSNETPSGYVRTKGVGAVESGREIMATLNTLKLYSGAPKAATVGNVSVQVGGIARKEELMNRYFATVGTGVRDQDIMSKTLLSLEEEIFNDIGKYYGVEKSQIKKIYSDHSQKRDALMEEIRNRGYWASADENAEITIEKAPWLDSQLENGMYLMNFREAERIARSLSRSGTKATLYNAKDAGLNLANGAYEAFNALWRPAVLLRLGYTQRNVAEGLFRSMAYLGSVRPLMDASKAMYYGVRNPVVRKQVEAEVRRTDQALANGAKLTDRMGTKFGKWWQKELDGIDSRIAREQEWFDNTTADLKASNLTVDEADEIYKTLFAQERMLNQLKAKKELLMTENGALSMYAKQASAARRPYDGLLDRTDPIPWRNAFNNESDYTPIALMNASADDTTKQMLQLRYNATNSLLRAKRERLSVAVKPEDGDAYWEGVAQMLTQYRSSEVGQLILNGADAKAVARFLKTDPTGKEITKFLTGNEKWQGPDIRAGLDEAEQWAQTMIDRLNTLAPNPELQKLMMSKVALGAGRKAAPISGADVKRFLDRPEYRDKLGPAIGNIAEQIGGPSIRNLYNTAVQKTFYAIGTVPEDALVRFPFYGQTYERTANQIRRSLTEQYGDKIPMSEVNRAMMQAHRRALRDTRNYLYTIERRTNLGDKAEAFLPFVSATQNSLTSLGRLVWKDPALPFVLKNIWNTPDVMGWTDDQGQISVPIPHALLPDELENRLGITDLSRFTFDKNQFNVIFPETGYGFIPRPSPLVMVPVSELMKANKIFTVDPPEILKSIVGEETAGSLWEQFKTYMFGDQGGASTKPFSYDFLLAPQQAKLLQLVQGLDSKEYANWYTRFYRAELMKEQFGLRGPVTKQEIINMTNNFTWLRFGANVTAFTPPQYETNLQPLMDAMRVNEQLYGVDGAWKNAEMFGPTLALLGDISVSKNVAGIDPSTEAVARARRYSNIINDVSPSIDKSSLSSLGMILNTEVKGYYDESAYAWEFSNKIPGVSEEFRKLQTPEESLMQAQRNAGWTQYLKFMDQLKAIADQAGLKSYTQSPALKEAKKQMVASLSNNPLYEGWAQDYEDPTGTRTQDTIRILDTALRDPVFVKENNGPIWQAATLYLADREKIVELIKQSGKPSIDSPGNEAIKMAWDALRESYITTYNGWGTVANRYLSGDDNPKPLRTTLASMRGSE